MASTARTSDRVMSISLSVLVHALIAGALFWGWWQYHTAKSVPPSLAIQARVVQNTPATTAPPPVDAAALARAAAVKRQAEQEAAARAAAAKEAELAAKSARAAEAARQAEASRQAQEAQRQAEEQAAAREAQLEAERKAEAARKAKELKAKQDAEREQQRLAQQLQNEQAERQREADLRKDLQAEEHLQALESSPAKAEYLALIEAKISHAWSRPPSARGGVRCIVHLKQIPGGEITNVSVENCNGDDALRQSVETAAYRASPLPAPSDPALFDPNLTVTFAPDD